MLAEWNHGGHGRWSYPCIDDSRLLRHGDVCTNPFCVWMFYLTLRPITQGGPALVQVGEDDVAAAGMIFARVEGQEHPLHGHTLLVAGSHIQRFVESHQ